MGPSIQEDAENKHILWLMTCVCEGGGRKEGEGGGGGNPPRGHAWCKRSSLLRRAVLLFGSPVNATVSPIITMCVNLTSVCWDQGFPQERWTHWAIDAVWPLTSRVLVTRRAITHAAVPSTSLLLPYISTMHNVLSHEPERTGSYTWNNFFCTVILNHERRNSL